MIIKEETAQQHTKKNILESVASIKFTFKLYFVVIYIVFTDSELVMND